MFLIFCTFSSLLWHVMRAIWYGQDQMSQYPLPNTSILTWWQYCSQDDWCFDEIFTLKIFDKHASSHSKMFDITMPYSSFVFLLNGVFVLHLSLLTKQAFFSWTDSSKKIGCYPLETSPCSSCLGFNLCWHSAYGVVESPHTQGQGICGLKKKKLKIKLQTLL